MITADQLLLGFGQIERGAVCLGMDADQEHHERQRLIENIPGRNPAHPIVSLLVDDRIKIERPEH